MYANIRIYIFVCYSVLYGINGYAIVTYDKRANNDNGKSRKPDRSSAEHIKCIRTYVLRVWLSYTNIFPAKESHIDFCFCSWLVSFSFVFVAVFFFLFFLFFLHWLMSFGRTKPKNLHPKNEFHVGMTAKYLSQHQMNFQKINNE